MDLVWEGLSLMVHFQLAFDDTVPSQIDIGILGEMSIDLDGCIVCVVVFQIRYWCRGLRMTLVRNKIRDEDGELSKERRNTRSSLVLLLLLDLQ